MASADEVRHIRAHADMIPNNELLVTAATVLQAHQTLVKIITASTGNYDITLPDPALCPGRIFTFLVIGIGSDDAVVIDALGNTVKAGLDALGDGIIVESTGDAWAVLADYVA